MKSLKILLLLFITVRGFCDTGIPDFRLRVEGDGTDVSGNDFAGHHIGDSLYSSVYKVEGSFSYVPAENDNWESKGTYTFGDKSFSIAFNFRAVSLYGDDHVIFTNRYSTGTVQGFDIKFSEANRSIYGNTRNGSTTNTFATANNVITFGSWHHLVVISRTGSFTVWIDDSKLVMTDSVVVTDWGQLTDTIAIGAYTDGNQGEWYGSGYFDNFHFYDYELSAAQVDSLYNYRTSSTFQLGEAGISYNPPQLEPWKDAVEKMPYKTLALKYFKKGIMGEPLITQGAGGYDSTYMFTCHQYFAIPENVDNGDYVGIWLPNYSWLGSGIKSYSIQTNFNSAFAVNSTTGLITIADATKIDGKIVQADTLINLVIRSYSHGDGYEDDTASICVKENSDCIFIDYSQGINGSGTRASPEKDIDDITVTIGKAYFLKRGTTITSETTAITNHLATSFHPTLWGAYGTGTKPKFTSGTSSCFQLGTYDFDGYEVLNMSFYDLEIRAYTYSAFYILPPSDSIDIYNCDLYNNSTSTNNAVTMNDLFPDYLESDSNKIYDYKIINTDFDTIGAWAFIKGCPHLIQNCRFRHKTSTGYLVRITQGTKTTIKHSLFDSDYSSSTLTNSNIQMRGDDITLLDNRFNDMACGIYVTAPGGYNEVFPDSITATNNLFRNHGAYGIRFAFNTTSENHSVGNIFQDNFFDNGVSGIYTRNTLNTIIRRNLFRNGSGNGILGSAITTDVGMSIYYNLLYGYTGYDIDISLTTGLTVYNNTVDGTIGLTGSTLPVIRNNFYRILAHSGTASNNLDIDGIDTDDYFIDYVNKNFRLVSTATSAIDQGYNLSLTPDLQGTIVPQGIMEDVGAYEYIP